MGTREERGVCEGGTYIQTQREYSSMHMWSKKYLGRGNTKEKVLESGSTWDSNGKVSMPKNGAF